MNTDTPETDKAESCAECESDILAVCRGLERERDEARQLAEMYRNICFDWKWPKPEPFTWEKSTLLKTEQNHCANNRID